MAVTFWFWAIFAEAIVVFAVLVGPGRGQQNLLRDGRGRYSLSRFQVTIWTVVLFSLMGGLVVGRFVAGKSDLLGFSIPTQVLGLLGISLGTTVLAATIKVSKSTNQPAQVAAVPLGQRNTNFWEMLSAEEGAAANKSIDVAKFQNFIITIFLVISYIALVISEFNTKKTPSDITALPKFSETFLVLLGISHAGYLAAKLPSPVGTPTGPTMADRPGVT